MCISSIQQLNRNSIEFFLSTWTRSSSKMSLSKFLQCNICISSSRNPTEDSIEFFSFNHYWLGSEL